MTWQHIDENTLIDDSLVTCAEYQLFIDEMLEQGKYYQPDHWTSYQFPKGQAREPILGVRHSDAVAFCEWLTRRKGGEWQFRLPNNGEGSAFSIKLDEISPLGIWLSGNRRFTCVRELSSNTLILDHEHKLDFELDRELEHILKKDDTREIKQEHALGQTLDRVQTLDRDLDQTLTHALDRARAFAHHGDLDQALKLVHDLAHALLLVISLDIIRNVNLSLASDHDRSLINLRVHTIASECAHILTHNYERPLDLNRTLANDYEHAIDLDRDLSPALARDFDLALHIYVDLLILQERIAGRSPAFEGIRLVKERIR